MRSASMRVRRMGEEPLDLDKHRGMAAQKATDLRRTLVEVENHARELPVRQTALENQLLPPRADTWHEAAAKAGYVLNLYVASLPAEDPRHRNLVAAILDDFSRLTRNT